MKLSELFNLEAMDLAITANSRDEALEHLAQRFENAGGVSKASTYVERLLAREAQSSTGVGDEIAIPHAQDASIQQAAIIFGKSIRGIDWQSFDGQPAKLIFMIAAPEGAGGEHLKALAQLSKVLLQEGVKQALLEASTPEEVLAIISSYDEEEKEEATHPNHSEAYLVAVTACPTGIAHTYMAEERLKQAAQAVHVAIKVETNGQSGIENRLTKEDIERATAVIVAADKQVAMARFDGKPLLSVPVADGVNKADQLVKQALHEELPLYHAASVAQGEEEKAGSESLGRQVYLSLIHI